MNKFFVLLLLSLSAGRPMFAAQMPQTHAEKTASPKITLKVFPEFLVKCNPDKGERFIVYALLNGFEFTNNQVQIDSQSNDIFTMLGNGKQYTTGTLIDALLTGKESSYPLHLHKKLNYLNSQSQLEIMLCYKNQTPITVKLPNDMNNRILKYLQRDMAFPFFDCWDFFKMVFFDDFNIDLTDLKTTQISSLRDIMLGDGILMASIEDGKPKITHCAISLGGNLFISKLGASGMICITTMQTLFSTYNCKNVYKVIGLRK